MEKKGNTKEKLGTLQKTERLRKIEEQAIYSGINDHRMH